MKFTVMKLDDEKYNIQVPYFLRLCTGMLSMLFTGWCLIPRVTTSGKLVPTPIGALVEELTIT